jgi:hypothetical protein
MIEWTRWLVLSCEATSNLYAHSVLNRQAESSPTLKKIQKMKALSTPVVESQSSSVDYCTP